MAGDEETRIVECYICRACFACSKWWTVSSYEAREEASSRVLPTTPRPKPLVSDREEQRIQLGKDVFLSQEQFAVAVNLRKMGSPPAIVI